MSTLAARLQAALNILSPGYPNEAAAVQEAIELRWRVTGDERPKAGEIVQLRLRDGGVYVGSRTNSGVWLTRGSRYHGGEVVAWRPLSEE